MNKKILKDVFGDDFVQEIWTKNYEKVLPLTIQDFDLGAVLPAMFYMFRYGHRRGRGKFLDTYSTGGISKKEKQMNTSIESTANKLRENEAFVGFDSPTTLAILGDLLLCYCLENIRHEPGRNKQIQRVAPAHYMSAWIDLPLEFAHLRFVPEMMVAILANQNDLQQGFVQPSKDIDRTWFPIAEAKCFEKNVLLKPFSAGMSIRGLPSNLTSDTFDEKTAVGIDQLLMIRLAQKLESAPEKISKKDGDQISNQRPIVDRSAEQFSEDIRLFVRAYAERIPRKSFVPMLESCMAIGLVTILSSTVRAMTIWQKDGTLPSEQPPIPLFVDVSCGTNTRLRAAAEKAFDDYLRPFHQFPKILMMARLLHYQALRNREIKSLAEKTRPYATNWINLLGKILHKRHEQYRRILERIEDYLEHLKNKLKDQDNEDLEQDSALCEDKDSVNPVESLARILLQLSGGEKQRTRLIECLDSSLMADRPNGLAVKRRVQTQVGTKRKTTIARSMVFTDTVLDYLVHRHVIKPRKNRINHHPISVQEFLRDLQDRYGFYVDKSPPGQDISTELLRENRTILERRLRDLGLLTGVNDAESMKRLQPRFEVEDWDNDDSE